MLAELVEGNGGGVPGIKEELIKRQKKLSLIGNARIMPGTLLSK